MNLPIATSTVAEALITAGAGLLGVLIGGLITLWIQRESHKAARKDERKRIQRASDAARRLLSIEVGNARDAVWRMRRTGQWPIGWDRTWSAAWRDFRGALLTRPPNDEALRQIGQACARIDELQKGVNTGRNDDERILRGRDQTFLWEMQQILEPACAALDYPSDEAERPKDPTAEQLDDWRNKPDEKT